jgi:hypothetical protein
LVITGKFVIFFFTVTGKNVTGKFRGFKLDHFTRFYLKLAGKTAVFSPKLHGFFKISQMF